MSGRSRVLSIIRLKCPACGKGPLFNGGAFDLRRMLEMPDSCPVCGQDFRIEPGFYSGAPYISYPIVLMLAVPAFLTLTLYCDFSFPVSFGITLAALLAIQPPIMRFSRSVWIHIFVRPVRTEN